MNCSEPEDAMFIIVSDSSDGEELNLPKSQDSDIYYTWSDDVGYSSSPDTEIEVEADRRWKRQCEYKKIAFACTPFDDDIETDLLGVDLRDGLLEEVESSPFCKKNKKGVADYEMARRFDPLASDENPSAEPYYCNGVEFPYRKLGSELWEVPPYVPLFVVHPGRVHHFWMNHEKNDEWWRKALIDVPEDTIDLYIDCIQRYTSSSFWSRCLTAPDRLPQELRALLDDLEYRRFYAIGKYTLLSAWRLNTEGRTEGDWFYSNRFGEQRTAQDWDGVFGSSESLIELDRKYRHHIRPAVLDWPISLVNRTIHARMRERYVEYCCYTPYLGVEENYNRLGPDGLNNRVTRELLETIECIRLIQKQFHPKLNHGTNSYQLAWDSKRFGYHAMNGLFFWPSIVWSELFRPVKDVPEFSSCDDQSILMKATIMEALIYEGYNRNSLRSLVQWEYFNVEEMLPHMFWWENVNKMLPHGVDRIFFDPDKPDWKERLLAFFDVDCWELIELTPNYKELERCIVRSIDDHAEYGIRFQCDHCKQVAVNKSFVMMPVDSVIEGVSVCDGLMYAKEHGFGRFEYCWDQPDGGDHNAQGHVPTGEMCCAVHSSLQLNRIKFDSKNYIRCCYDCSKEKKRYLFLGKAHLDRGVDMIRQHTGAWWLDVEKVQQMLGFKHNAKKVAKR